MPQPYTRMTDILEYIRKNPGVATKKIKIHFGLSTYSTSNGFLRKAIVKGLIRAEKIKGDLELKYFAEGGG